MKQIQFLLLAITILSWSSCDKISSDPLEIAPSHPPELYDSVPLNELTIIWGNREWPVHSFDVTYQNSKLYFNIHTKKNFNATAHFILVNFAVDSFAFGIGSSNIANYRYPTFNENGALVDYWASSFNGDFPSGYFVIDFVDTLDKIVYGYFEFMNPEDPAYPDYKKISKSYFKVNYVLGPNASENNSADIFINAKAVKEIDFDHRNYFPWIYTDIVFDDNNALSMYFFHEKLVAGKNNIGRDTGFNSAWLYNIDFPIFFYGFSSDVVLQADSGYVDIELFDVEKNTIKGNLNLFFKNEHLTGKFQVEYQE